MNGSATALRIDAVDAFARTLYLRTKQIATPPPALDDAAVAVRQMHISLRHLRVEAGDPTSVLNKADAAGLYAGELAPIVDHCEFALKQLETVLDRLDGGEGKDGLTERIVSVTARIAEKELDVAFFLDTVQLRPNTTADVTTAAMPDHETLEDIKEEVDFLASKVFRRHAGVVDNDSEGLWEEFKTELERQGFTAEELQTHKTPTRAYIRQLGSTWNRSCGATPTYQSVAEFEANTAPQAVQPPAVPPKVPILPPKEKSQQSPRNEKAVPSVKADRLSADKPSATVLPSQYSFNAPPAGDEKDADLSMALISTKDLVAMDSLHNGMASMNLNANSGGRLGDDLSRSPNNQMMLSASPRYHSSHPADARNGQHRSSSPNNRIPRLAPDRYGRDIPPDAQWTRIRRTLISPEVLDRAGVRYEARPEYVAVLGRLSRHEIAEFARQSAECRAARSTGGHRPPPLPQRPKHTDYPDARHHHSDDDVLYDESDSTEYEDDRGATTSPDKGTRSYPYIVSAPSKSKTSPSTTVKPKPILKNKNENHVRFDPEPHEVEHPNSAPSSYHNDGRRRDYYDGGSSSRRHRDHYDRDHDRDRPHRSHRDRRERKKKSWGETLGAVGIGSAALLLGGVGVGF